MDSKSKVYIHEFNSSKLILYFTISKSFQIKVIVWNLSDINQIEFKSQSISDIESDSLYPVFIGNLTFQGNCFSDYTIHKNFIYFYGKGNTMFFKVDSIIDLLLKEKNNSTILCQSANNLKINNSNNISLNLTNKSAIDSNNAKNKCKNVNIYDYLYNYYDEDFISTNKEWEVIIKDIKLKSIDIFEISDYFNSNIVDIQFSDNMIFTLSSEGNIYIYSINHDKIVDKFNILEIIDEKTIINELVINSIDKICFKSEKREFPYKFLENNNFTFNCFHIRNNLSCESQEIIVGSNNGLIFKIRAFQENRDETIDNDDCNNLNITNNTVIIDNEIRYVFNLYEVLNLNSKENSNSNSNIKGEVHRIMSINSEFDAFCDKDSIYYISNLSVYHENLNINSIVDLSISNCIECFIKKSSDGISNSFIFLGKSLITVNLFDNTKINEKIDVADAIGIYKIENANCFVICDKLGNLQFKFFSGYDYLLVNPY